MIQCAVIADDLTGGNATGVLLAEMGYKSFTILNENGTAAKDCDCVIYPTDSRSISPEEAYSRVRNITRSLYDTKDTIKIWSKRIDSTLRGNIGSETDAMIDGRECDSDFSTLFPVIRAHTRGRLYDCRRPPSSQDEHSH